MSAPVRFPRFFVTTPAPCPYLSGKTERKVFTDLQLSWTPPVFDQQLQLAVGINNVLDEDPPPCLSCDLNNFDGTLYPVPGRFFHARAALKF